MFGSDFKIPSLATNEVSPSLDFAELPRSLAWLTNISQAREGIYLDKVVEQPAIYISCSRSAASKELLQDNKIGAIFSIVPQVFESFSLKNTNAQGLASLEIISSSSPVYGELGIKRYHLALSDDGNNPKASLILAVESLEEICRKHESEGILVHCRSGHSRSVSVVAALISRSLKCSFEEAVNEIALHRGLSIKEDLARSLTQALQIPLQL